MRRYLPGFLLLLAALSPLTLLGCDGLLAKLKGGSADAGNDAAVAVVVPELDAAAITTAATATAAAPTGTLAATPTGTVVRPVIKTDGGTVIVDAGAKKADAGPAPAPTPTLTIPTNL